MRCVVRIKPAETDSIAKVPNASAKMVANCLTITTPSNAAPVPMPAPTASEMLMKQVQIVVDPPAVLDVVSVAAAKTIATANWVIFVSVMMALNLAPASPVVEAYILYRLRLCHFSFITQPYGIKRFLKEHLKNFNFVRTKRTQVSS